MSPQSYLLDLQPTILQIRLKPNASTVFSRNYTTFTPPLLLLLLLYGLPTENSFHGFTIQYRVLQNPISRFWCLLMWLEGLSLIFLPSWPRGCSKSTLHIISSFDYAAFKAPANSLTEKQKMLLSRGTQFQNGIEYLIYKRKIHIQTLLEICILMNPITKVIYACIQNLLQCLNQWRRRRKKSEVKMLFGRVLVDLAEMYIIKLVQEINFISYHEYFCFQYC